MVTFPEKKYGIIYADPPWKYTDRALAGSRGAECKYTVQDIDWLKSLPVESIADKDCTLFMWTTMPMLEASYPVIRSWGFKPVTVGFVWIKKNKNKPTNFMGMGNWTRANAEVCLLATRGKPKRISASVHSVIESPIREHSRKPDEVRDRIVELLGDLPRIELFARSVIPGWDAWGDQLGTL